MKRWVAAAAFPALLLRIWLVIRPEWFWYDEAFSVILARLPLDRLLVATAGDVHPPLYYLLLAGWLRLTGFLPLEIAARSLSLILSLIALYLYWHLLPRLGLNNSEAIAAWLLAAWLPALIYFASEARMYALLEVEVLAALLALLTGKWWLAGLWLGCCALTQNVGLIYAVVVAVAVLLIRWSDAKHAIAQIAAAGAFAAVLWAPWAAILIRQAGEAKQGYWIWDNGLGTVAYMVYQSIAYYRLPDWAAMPAVMLLSGMTIVGAVLMIRPRPWLVVFGLGPALMTWAISVTTNICALLHRMLVPATFGLAAIWAALLMRRDVGRVLCMLMVAVFGVASVTYVLDGRDVADYSFLSRIQAQPGDVMYASNVSALPLGLYTDLPLYYTPTAGGIAGGNLSRQTAEALQLPVAWLDDLVWQRAWLIYNRLPYDLPDERAYVDELITRYDGEQIASLGDGAIVNGEVWLLKRFSRAGSR